MAKVPDALQFSMAVLQEVSSSISAVSFPWFAVQTCDSPFDSSYMSVPSIYIVNEKFKICNVYTKI